MEIEDQRLVYSGTYLENATPRSKIFIGQGNHKRMVMYSVRRKVVLDFEAEKRKLALTSRVMEGVHRAPRLTSIYDFHPRTGSPRSMISSAMSAHLLLLPS